MLHEASSLLVSQLSTDKSFPPTAFILQEIMLQVPVTNANACAHDAYQQAGELRPIASGTNRM